MMDPVPLQPNVYSAVAIGASASSLALADLLEYMKMGVDTLLTNNCLAIARAFERAGIL